MPSTKSSTILSSEPIVEDCEENTQLPSGAIPAADTLRGWLVVAGAFIYFMMSIGCVNSYGVYNQEYQINEFPHVPSSTLAWIGTMQFGTIGFLAVGSGILVERFDARWVGGVGTIIAGTGLLAASACTTPTQLVVTQGIIFGIGGSGLVVVAMSLPLQWMDKYRPLAAGIAVAGSSIGGLWMSFATRAMVSRLGRQWALRITGLLLIAVCGAATPLMKRRIHVPPRDKIIDYTVLGNAKFVILFLFGIVGMAGYYLPYAYMPSFSVVVLHQEPSWGAVISAILNVGSFFGRIITGTLAGSIGSTNALLLSTFLAVLSILGLWLPFKNLAVLAVAAFLFGSSSGSIVSLVPVVTATLFGIKRLPSILGLILISYSFGMLLGSPVGGRLLDVYGHGTNYMPLLIYSGAVYAVGLVLFIILRWSMSNDIRQII
ncbi:MFS general substrate transporter [Linderina pennispora]|uniref:MFS general substrate transporter n=1 Tax=Linderina pennispora TaxID=61395 RepID=A0A1Y1WB29_9FUNG|nr:MFS general substrate transporter [Linderina pennispora]ORX70364.1 MFS general substrate transporter [Linderina pennispora]